MFQKSGSLGKASKKHVSKDHVKEICVKAEPIIEWLKKAEEEGSSEAEEEDEEEGISVLYQKSVSVSKVKSVKSDNRDDDICIHAI